MTTSTDDWTGKWVANTLKQNGLINGYEFLKANKIRISRDTGPHAIICTTSKAQINGADVSLICSEDPKPDFLVSLNREGVILGEAIHLAAQFKMVIGNMGQLKSAIHDEDISAYVPREIQFVERMLIQHSSVDRLTRLDDKRYLIHRVQKPAVIVMLINEYELTSDHVRTAWNRYGSCDYILSTNGFGRATRSAFEAAAVLKCQICTSKQLMGALVK